ncbi:MAG: TlpA family protein disulfide reductase [Gammaproteobacteria bacterium]|nr:TlpA family protein disulfide reductase [Gammaproteobacteria bacterium]
MVKWFLSLFVLLCSQPLLANSVDLELTDMEGRQFKLSDYRGKWVVLNYWATWCPPCLEEIPELIYFHDTHKDSRGVVIGIDMEMLEPAVLAQFVDDNFISYPIVPLVAEMPSFESVNNYPTTYLIDPDGIPVAKHVGALTAVAIEQFIDSYAAENPAKQGGD